MAVSSLLVALPQLVWMTTRLAPPFSVTCKSYQAKEMTRLRESNCPPYAVLTSTAHRSRAGSDLGDEWNVFQQEYTSNARDSSAPTHTEGIKIGAYIVSLVAVRVLIKMSHVVPEGEWQNLITRLQGPLHAFVPIFLNVLCLLQRWPIRQQI